MRCLFEDVALRAGLEAASQQAALAVGREDEDSRLRDLFSEDLGRLQPVHAGHADVHDHDLGLAPLGERDGRGSVRSLSDHADMRRARKRKPEPLANDLVVVHDQNGDLLAPLPVFSHGPPDCMREIG